MLEEAPKVKESSKSDVPAKRNGTGKFEVVADGGKFWIFNPEGVRISGGLSDIEAHDQAARHQSFLR